MFKKKVQTLNKNLFYLSSINYYNIINFDGLLNFKKYFSYHAKKNQKPGNRANINKEKFNKIDLEIKGGDYLIMNGNLVHGSYSNNSKKNSRHMISFNYGVKGYKFIPGKTAQRKSIAY